ncbi:hypothetical protein A7P96_00840 [Eikenella sp. NML03-A-027]|uniref:hypothetical protein n=1 Tax=Eikenella sp. NML03-A-027 TaxID=1795828 RepID=UPI0007E14404|nr:hypothetical protein [Eikenella sp. NML03-A-027]OAM32751.1 hypothetical protein A7P96_00840 [Eikenella sp. NML03-A-027]
MTNNAIPQVKTVHIMLLGMDERQYAMFRMAFKMHGITNYELVTVEQGIQPDMVLADADTDVEIWKDAKNQFPDAKVVYFSSLPPPVTAPYLAKPIKFDTLFLNLKNLQQGNGIWVASSSRAEHAPRLATQETEQASSVRSHSASITIEHFDEDNGLLGEVRKAAKQDVNVAVMHNGKPMLLVFPSIQKVLLVTDSETLKSLCEQKFVDLQTRAITEENLKAKAKLSITACLWQLAIWTSNGRFPKVINKSTVFKVRNWPNLTRLAPLAESMRLSAFLTKASGSLTILHKLMLIDNKDLADYLTAVYVTDHLIVESAGQAETQTAGAGQARVAAQTQTIQRPERVHTRAHEEDSDEEVPKQRGLLQRLMNKIIGR